MRFPQQGWLRVDESIEREWLKRERRPEEASLDDLGFAAVESRTDLVTELKRLEKELADVSQDRVKSLTNRTLRRDGKMVRTLKRLVGYSCQFPDCQARIRKKDGGSYVEVAHITAVHRGGRSVIGNLLVLCPNHHKEFDHGDLVITHRTAERLVGTLNGTPFEITVGLNPNRVD